MEQSGPRMNVRTSVYECTECSGIGYLNKINSHAPMIILRAF